MGELQEARPGWRIQLKSQAEVDRFKRGLLKALLEQNISSQEDIQRGLRMVRSESGDYLPGVGTFIQWCKPEIEHWEHARIRKATQEFLSLPKPEIHKEVGIDAIAKLKQSIGIKKT
jgi:hypothetical protein